MLRGFRPFLIFVSVAVATGSFAFAADKATRTKKSVKPEVFANKTKKVLPLGLPSKKKNSSTARSSPKVLSSSKVALPRKGKLPGKTASPSKVLAQKPIPKSLPLQVRNAKPVRLNEATARAYERRPFNHYVSMQSQILGELGKHTLHPRAENLEARKTGFATLRSDYAGVRKTLSFDAPGGKIDLQNFGQRVKVYDRHLSAYVASLGQSRDAKIGQQLQSISRGQGSLLLARIANREVYQDSAAHLVGGQQQTVMNLVQAMGPEAAGLKGVSTQMLPMMSDATILAMLPRSAPEAQNPTIVRLPDGTPAMMGDPPKMQFASLAPTRLVLPGEGGVLNESYTVAGGSVDGPLVMPFPEKPAVAATVETETDIAEEAARSPSSASLASADTGKAARGSEAKSKTDGDGEDSDLGDEEVAKEKDGKKVADKDKEKDPGAAAKAVNWDRDECQGRGFQYRDEKCWVEKKIADQCSGQKACSGVWAVASGPYCVKAEDSCDVKHSAEVGLPEAMKTLLSQNPSKYQTDLSRAVEACQQSSSKNCEALKSYAYSVYSNMQWPSPWSQPQRVASTLSPRNIDMSPDPAEASAAALELLGGGSGSGQGAGPGNR